MTTAAEAREAAVLAWPEVVFQSHVLELAQRLGWWAYHTHDSRRSEPGYPDLHLIHAVQRRSLFRELKTQKGRLSTAQTECQSRMIRAGLDFAVWKPSDLISGRIVADLKGKRFDG